MLSYNIWFEHPHTFELRMGEVSRIAAEAGAAAIFLQVWMRV